MRRISLSSAANTGLTPTGSKGYRTAVRTGHGLLGRIDLGKVTHSPLLCANCTQARLASSAA